jgi:hypothetical protein
MSSSKKTSSKSRQSPAPATKSAAKPAPRQAPKRRPRASVAAQPSPVPAAKVRPAPAQSLPTVISARVDVGFGNALFLRGDGPGLSWDLGIPLECVGADLWRIILAESRGGFSCKFLINDLTWNTGPDYVVAAGQSVTFTPKF